MREITEIFVHCSDTRPSMNIGAAEIRKWHTDPKPKGNGWSDIGYHYIVKRDGTSEVGRPVEVAGAHVAGRNANSIGICMVGGMTENGKGAEANFTMGQWLALNTILRHLRAQYPQAVILGHRDADSSKQCPCFDAKALFP